MNFTDLHTHICKAGMSSMLEYCGKQGIRNIGISEHVYQITEIHADYPELLTEGELFPLEQYLRFFEEAKEIELYKGIELDIIPGKTERLFEKLEHIEWDYVIGSVHAIGKWDIHFPHSFAKDECHMKWHEYIETQIEWIENGNGQILGHPVRMAITLPETPDDIDECLLSLAVSAYEHGKAIEINSRDHLIAPGLVERLMESCKKAGCMVTFGSDAHEPTLIRRNFPQLAQLLHKHGITASAVWRGGHPKKYDLF